MLIKPAEQTYRTWILDSRRWQRFRPRHGDIVIASYPKTGTTWMQQIVRLIVLQTTEPMPLPNVSPWVERRFPEPIEQVMERIEAQTHRRFLKTHLPLDGLPLHDEVKYIHVTRDGRDACLSFHNHGRSFSEAMLAGLDKAGLDDEAVARPYPRIPPDPAEHFHRWLTEGVVPGHADGSPTVSFFHFERSWFAERLRPNILLVHYSDLTADLEGEMRRVAAFLEIDVPADLWPELMEAARFEAMARDGAKLMPGLAATLQRGAGQFFHKGTNERWRGIYRDEDLALYEAKLGALPAACTVWVREGRKALAAQNVGKNRCDDGRF